MLLGAGSCFDDLLGLPPSGSASRTFLQPARLGARAFNYSQVAEITPLTSRRASARAHDPPDRALRPLGARASSSDATGPLGSRAVAGVSERGPQILRQLTRASTCLLPQLTNHAIHSTANEDRMIFVIPLAPSSR